MSESFDPYHAWLGIPPKQQPPTHYRLLAIEPFESDPSVIESAADQRMAHLRSFQTGKRGALTQRLLNEVAAAKVCLLDPNKKAAYDAALRQQQAAEESDAVSAEVFASVAETAPKRSSISAKSQGKSKPSPALVAGSAAVIVLVLIAACIFLSNIFLSNKNPSDEPQSVAQTDTALKRAAPDATPPDTAPAEAGNVGQAASLPVTENAPEKPESSTPPKPDAPGAVRGSPNPAQGSTEGLPAAPETSGQATGGVGRPAPSAPPPPASDTEPKATEEVQKHPIPSSEIQREIATAIEETYKTSQAKTPEAKVALAKELSAAAGKSAKPEEQYVLLRKAIDLACDGGDATLMLETIAPMTEAFAIDPLLAKAAMLERFAKGPRSPARVQSLAESSWDVIEEALAEDRYEIASNLARTVADACSRSTPQVRKEAADRRKRVGQLQKQFEEVQKALETLKANPEDAEANLAAGAWYAFVKDDWKTGLAHLAKGSDPVLKSLAGREVSSPPATPEDQLKLADAWWDAAAERRGEQQAAMLRTAGHWYEQAIGQLQGINKTKAEKRLSQIAELAQDTPSRPGREPPSAIAPFDAKRARGYQLQWARYLKVPVEFTNSIGMKFVLIPPGEFDMGSSRDLAGEASQGAKPQHRVRITKPFWLGVAEVTNAEFARVMGPTKAGSPDQPLMPAGDVSWDKATEFCRRLSDIRGEKLAKRVYHLPTEAQWEFACRAGSPGEWCFASQANATAGPEEEKFLGEFAWFIANSGAKMHPVAQKRPNAWGLCDMHGNAWEWCADWYDRNYYGNSPTDDPTGPAKGWSRVIRSGGCGTPAIACRSACRLGREPGNSGYDWGFRVAASIPVTID